MDAIIADMQTSTHLPIAVITARLVGAGVLAGIIGIEREFKSRPAGLRTHMIVALAAALFAILSIEVVHAPVFGDVSVQADPMRVIEAVTAGVAFLAAGFIIFAKGEVTGVTTGAGIWLAAAIGLSTGLGYWLVGAIAALTGLVILIGLRHVERWMAVKD
jgi:putative Mg2+ transporter-C (MgtC) family protein